MVGEEEGDAEEETTMVGEEVTDISTAAEEEEEEEDIWTMRIETKSQTSIHNQFNNRSFNQKQTES